MENFKIDEPKKLKELFKGIKLTQDQFAKRFGLKSGSNVSQYVTGNRTLTLSSALKFSKGFNVPLGVISPRLESEIGSKLPTSEVTPTVFVGCSVPLLKELTMKDKQIDLSTANSISTSLDVSSNAFACEVHDSAMIPVIAPGDIIIVDPTRQPRPGCIVLAHLNGSFFIRRYTEPSLGSVLLQPENPAYPLLDLSKNEADVIGPIVEIRKFPK